ncbi:hypothetical protein A3B51_00965 [Candidatus Curtissbacteria bacterium RIFCSPLOWO2_01_FULL_41_18]|uniref:SCP domain-containing protein n=1 Tax=Candidatus Curtissbacteria bacterium RIFCSPLOWO2_01_FULL_41_18 TaxID=1797727 RepID=A0A1F5HN86_9BACT|nr:MAG: hypothetical protein A3B51_00965 [Candidatus Curtissbacteria bacterium RIFCSPLOWO2_01_FULL_41_18]
MAYQLSRLAASKKIAQRVVSLHKHFVPYVHEDGPAFTDGSGEARQHHAHVLSLTALFVYFQVFVFLTIGFYFVRATLPQILGTASYSADQIIALTNQKRAENGLPALSINGNLAAAAGAKASDMLAVNYWAHNSPSGRTPWSFISGAGYKYITAGENLARDFSDAGSVVGAWMNSPTHRSNILDGNFAEVGVAVVSGSLQGKEGILVVQMFGGGVSQVPQAVASPGPSVEPTTIAQAPQVAAPVATTATVLASRQFSVAKVASLGLIGFIFALFALEVLITVRRVDLTVRSSAVAHLGILGFVLLALWYAVQGAVI